MLVLPPPRSTLLTSEFLLEQKQLTRLLPAGEAQPPLAYMEAHVAPSYLAEGAALAAEGLLLRRGFGSASAAEGLKCPPPSLTTAPHLPPWLLWRLRVGLSNPKPRLISSEAEEASWKVAGRSAQNEPWPL